MWDGSINSLYAYVKYEITHFFVLNNFPPNIFPSDVLGCKCFIKNKKDFKKKKNSNSLD